MNRELLIGRILEDESLRGDLTGDAGHALIEWLVREAEKVISKSKSQSKAGEQIDSLCRRGQQIARFVTLVRDDPTAAAELAKTEKFPWPLRADGDQTLWVRQVVEAC